MTSACKVHTQLLLGWVLQEVVGDERSALQAVVAADAELMELREEEEQLNQQLQESSLEEQPKGFNADEASQRLNEVSFCNTLLCCGLFTCHFCTKPMCREQGGASGRVFGQTCLQSRAMFCCDSTMHLGRHHSFHMRQCDW